MQNQNLSIYTTLGIGGNADYLVRVHDKLQLYATVDWAKQNNLPVTVIGRGSKLLISDKGIRGVVILFTGMDSIVIEGRVVTAEVGASLVRVSNLTVAQNLRGLEWAIGIPATIGGAIVMNAGAYDGAMSDVISEVEYFNGSNFVICQNEDCGFEYRRSIFMDNSQYIITSAKMELVPYKREKLEEMVALYKEKRKASQPLGVKTAGSTFKKAGNISAAEVLDKAGLKGYTIGGAKISEVHANFIENFYNASCQDVLKLIEYMQDVIFDKTGIIPELEIRILGEF